MSSLIARFPALESIPRVSLGAYPTPVVSLASAAPNLWIKRDDLSADPIGGNKVRSLEFLLGRARPGDRVVTVGSEGSPHALAVATYAARLGASADVGRWRQVMNATAKIVSRGIAATAERAPVFTSPIGAYLWAGMRRVRGAHWIPAGGSSALGVLGHVNAGLELVDQIDAGLLPMPSRVVVPLGTGGTAAGLALAFAIAERPIVVVGARVVPRVVARAARVRALADACARLIEATVGQSISRVRASNLSIVHDVYGGAYGRETIAGRLAAERARAAGGVDLDATYSAKAFAAALSLAGNAPTLFWLTFDSRPLRES